jgi:glycosyltransferase involved in cell wall biosynthesis
MNDPPEEVRELAEQRAERRRARDYAGADEVRDRIRGLGFEIADRPDGGYDVLPVGVPDRVRVLARNVESILDRPPAVDLSVHWLSEGWPEDVLRGIASFRRFEAGHSVHHVVVEARAEQEGTWPADVEVIPLSEDPGFGIARNTGLRRSLGRMIVIVDGSVEAEGDPYSPLEEALADASVGIAGPYGLVTDDLREFAEADGPEVDAVEGYMMAFRRELLVQGLAFEERYRFYRAADIDLSFQAKAMGLRVMRVDVPVQRHAHRRWATTSVEDRERLSKRNFYRFLDRFRGRTDLLVSRR